MKFRKKPVVIEAVRWTGENMEEVKGLGAERLLTFEPGRVYIETLEGVMAADIGDWIIKGVKGEIYPCRDDIFRTTYAATYEPAESPR